MTASLLSTNALFSLSVHLALSLSLSLSLFLSLYFAPSSPPSLFWREQPGACPATVLCCSQFPSALPSSARHARQAPAAVSSATLVACSGATADPLALFAPVDDIAVWHRTRLCGRMLITRCGGMHALDPGRGEQEQSQQQGMILFCETTISQQHEQR